MAAGWRTVRVFISSTFRDMQAERDHLVRFVFPRLREELLKRRVHLVDVDLRWGVTAEEDALSVCREIIDECRPRFICMLGGRYGWTPPGEERSITADEVHYAALDRLDVEEYRYFYFREDAATESIPGEAARAGGYREFPADDETEEMARERARKLEALKERVREAGLPVFEYPCRWDPQRQRLIGLEEFGEAVYRDLLASVDDELGTEPPAEPDWFAEENAAMEAFIEERTQRYVVGSRQALLDEMTAHAEGAGEPSVLVVTGEPGSGKSALLGRFYRDYVGTDECRAHPDETVIPHFVGASQGSTSIRLTLRRLCHELVQAAGIEDEIPEDIHELVQALPEFLARAAATKRVVIVVDALNQLDATENAHTLNWLPRELPEGVRVICSSLEHPALEALGRRTDQVREVVCGPLTADDAGTIVDATLARYHKRFDDAQRSALLSKPDAGVPLYLLAAVEELRTLGTYELIATRIGEMPGTVTDLFDWILRRLAEGVEGQEAFGEDLVSAYTSYIAIGRGGMTEGELEALCAPVDEEHEFWVLHRMLRPYLMRRGELVDYFHGQLREAVERRYLSDDAARQQRHVEIAGLLGAAGRSSRRTLGEFAYHLYRSALLGGDPEPLYALVDDPGFRQAQFEAFLIPEPVVTGLNYALEVSARHHCVSRLVHFSLMRVRVRGELCRQYLYRLESVAEENPDLALIVVRLVPDPRLRRLGLLLLAWEVSDRPGQEYLARDVLREAASISVPALMTQCPALLELIAIMWRAGYGEAGALLKAIPRSPVSDAYMRAWARAPGRMAELAGVLTEAAQRASAAGAPEIADLDRMQRFVADLQRGRLGRRQPEAIEELIFDTFGRWGGPEVYFLMAAEGVQSGQPEWWPRGCIKRGLFTACSLPAPALRTLAALGEVAHRSGLRDLAAEHAARGETLTKALGRFARTSRERAEIGDAQADLQVVRALTEPAWRPSTVDKLYDEVLSERSVSENREEMDGPGMLSRARQLLARGRPEPAALVLHEAFQRVAAEHGSDGADRALVAAHALARGCGDEPLADRCAERLQRGGWEVEELYRSGDITPAGQAVSDLVVQSDARCVASVALGLRLAGSGARLLDLVRSWATSECAVETLDALLAEVVRSSDPDANTLRCMSDDIVGTTAPQLEVPQGWGMYYFPGTMLASLWLGAVCIGIGLGATRGTLGLWGWAAALVACGLLGAHLDLLVWRLTRLWDQPEKSRHWWECSGTLAVFVAWCLVARPHFDTADRQVLWMGLVACYAVFAILFLAGARAGLMFSDLAAHTVAKGHLAAVAVAGLAAWASWYWSAGVAPPHPLLGVFLGGCLQVALAGAILPKRIAILRWYAKHRPTSQTPHQPLIGGEDR